MDEFLARLDRFASTPTGSLTLVLLTALIRLILPHAVRIQRNRKVKRSKGAQGA